MKSQSSRLSCTGPSLARVLLFTAALLGSVLTAAEPEPAPASAPSPVAPPAGRLHGTFEGIECEYSPGQEKLAELLAHRFAEHNARAAAEAAKPKPPLPILPLSPVEMRERRADYLGRIAAQLGLKQPTAWQEECYDAFLRNYALTMELFEHMRAVSAELQTVKRFTVWSREELVLRLESGEKIAGMRYDPETKQVKVEFGVQFERVNSQLKELGEARKRLRADYRFSIKSEGDQSVYRGSVSTKKADQPTATRESKQENKSSLRVPEASAFPVVIPNALTGEPAETAAQKLWNEGEPSIREALGYLAKMPDELPRLDLHLAYLVLHETTEVGIIDHYMRGPDRRWFCDGVANYVPWRVVRDLHGAQAADAVYNPREELAKHAALREQADLRRWPAAENQSAEEQHTPLDSARYAFAAHAIFLMNDRAGDDALPRLFAEIGKTNAKKVSIKTVEKAWKKLSGGKLDDLLAAAGTIPASPAPAAATGAPK